MSIKQQVEFKFEDLTSKHFRLLDYIHEIYKRDPNQYLSRREIQRNVTYGLVDQTPGELCFPFTSEIVNNDSGLREITQCIQDLQNCSTIQTIILSNGGYKEATPEEAKTFIKKLIEENARKWALIQNVIQKLNLDGQKRLRIFGKEKEIYESVHHDSL
jgi:hypothetical protein